MTVPRHFYPELEKERTLMWMILISLGFHVAMFIMAVVLPNLNSSSRRFSPSYTVELMGMPSSAPPSNKPSAAQTPAQAKKEIRLPEKAPITPPVVQPQAPKPIPILKKEAPVKVKVEKPQTEKLLERQLAKLKRQEAAKEAKATLENALKDLERKVDAESPAEAPGTGMPGGGGGQGSPEGLKIEIYKASVWNKIRANWSYPELLAFKTNPEAIVYVQVTQDGHINNLRLIKESGNSLFDQSVVRAVKLSEPLPPFPEGYIKRYEELELRFSLEALTGNS
jgi:colicin import membrane protein